MQRHLQDQVSHAGTVKGGLHLGFDPADPWLSDVFFAVAGSFLPVSTHMFCLRD